MWILYDFIFLIVAILYLPVYLFRRKFHRGFLARLGFLPKDLSLERPIWIHAVSVGEAMALRNFIEEFRIAFPDKRLFITTVTPAGNKIARSICRTEDFVSYLPLDLSFIVRQVINKVRPLLFVLAETEIWPNLISGLNKKSVPIVVVNGRISDRSFKGYHLFRFLLKPILDKINFFCMQAKTDAERLIHLGVKKDKVQVTGNMKFDNADYAKRKDAAYADKYRALLKLNEGDKLWVSGSTHPGEEEIILEVYKRLLGEFPQLKLLIAPRHPERASQIDEIVSRFGFRTVLSSTLPLQPCDCITHPVFVLDTIGELIYFYTIASVVFVGGSFIKKGGQNILEPAAQGKPVIFGPHMFNFRDIAGLFLENEACILVHNKDELETSIRDLLNNPSRVTALTRKAKEIILQNQGASRRNLEFIKPYLGTLNHAYKVYEEGEDGNDK